MIELSAGRYHEKKASASRLTPCKWKGCGAPGALVAFMGKEIWMDELAGRE